MLHDRWRPNTIFVQIVSFGNNASDLHLVFIVLSIYRRPWPDRSRFPKRQPLLPARPSSKRICRIVKMPSRPSQKSNSPIISRPGITAKVTLSPGVSFCFLNVAVQRSDVTALHVLSRTEDIATTATLWHQPDIKVNNLCDSAMRPLEISRWVGGNRHGSFSTEIASGYIRVIPKEPYKMSHRIP